MTRAVALKKPAAARAARPAAEQGCGAGGGLPHAVVLNLARRPDRWESAKRRLARVKPPLSFERVEAVDGAAGADIPGDVVARSWSTARNWEYVTRAFEGGRDCGYTARALPLTGGERGCAASHVQVWRRCAAPAAGAQCGSAPSTGELDLGGATMVLEDDALPLVGFAARVGQALADLQEESPDVLYLGYTQAAPWRRAVGAQVREAEYLWTTVGYVLWPAGARKLLAHLPVDQPVDNFMSDLMVRRVLRGFAVVPAVVKQAKAWNVDNDVRHSDDAAWAQSP